MTVKELINELLDKEMNSEVMLFTKDPNRPDVTGVIFNITGVSASKCAPEIMFDDWRDKMDKLSEEGEQDDKSRSDRNAQTDARARGMGTTDNSSGV